LAAALCLLAACGAAAAGAYAWLSPKPVAASTSAEAPPEVTEGSVVVLTLRPDGFWPSEVTVRPGEYLLVVQNRSGLDDYSIRLDREAQGKLHEVKLSRKLDWRQQFNLTPGNYQVSESGHPEWSCRIAVTPR
jgi:hypothetical protein